MNKNIRNILYWENWEYNCKYHKISNIEIFYKNIDLEILYKFKNKDNLLALKILFTDTMHAYFLNELKINETIIPLIADEGTFVTHASTYINYTGVNTAKMSFKTDDNFLKDKLVEEYIWFMSLVRVEIFENEEDEFYIEQEINRRLLQTKCYSYEKMRQIIINSK